MSRLVARCSFCLAILLGNSGDDFNKAEYAIRLIKYLKRHGKTLEIPAFGSRDQNRYVVHLVNRVYDTAFFTKLANPCRSDLDCFAGSERECIKEKEIDYIAYFEYHNRIAQNRPGNEKTDYWNAINIYRNRRIEPIAYRIYLDRIAKGEAGDAESDYYNATRLFEGEESKRSIAEMRYIESIEIENHEKQILQDDWWATEQIVKILKSRQHTLVTNKIDPVALKLIDEQIHSILQIQP